MITITEAIPKRHAAYGGQCSSCYSQDQVYAFSFRGDDSPGSTTVELCRQCINNMFRTCCSMKILDNEKRKDPDEHKDCLACANHYSVDDGGDRMILCCGKSGKVVMETQPACEYFV